MRDRLPRKYKKKVKKVVARASASRMVRSALVTASSMAQLAMMQAQPFQLGGDRNAYIADKALSITDLVANTAKAISQFMSEKPHSWRDFLKTKDKRING